MYTFTVDSPGQDIVTKARTEVCWYCLQEVTPLIEIRPRSLSVTLTVTAAGYHTRNGTLVLKPIKLTDTPKFFDPNVCDFDKVNIHEATDATCTS